MVAQPILYAPPQSTRCISNNQSVPYPNLLRALFKSMGYSVREVSHETGFPERTLYYWAAGKCPIPHYAREELAPLLCCSLEDLAPKQDSGFCEQLRRLAAPPALAALFEHPDFQEGVKWGKETYYDMGHEGMLTEAEMVDVVEENLSRCALREGARFDQAMELAPDSYLVRLGIVVSVIAEGYAVGTRRRCNRSSRRS